MITRSGIVAIEKPEQPIFVVEFAAWAEDFVGEIEIQCK